MIKQMDDGLFSGGRVVQSTGMASRPTSDNEAPVIVPPPGERFNHCIASVSPSGEQFSYYIAAVLTST